MNTPSERLTVRCQMREDYNDQLKKGDIVWTTRDGYYDFFMYYADDITPSLHDRMLSELITSAISLPDLNNRLEKEFEKESDEKELENESDEKESEKELDDMLEKLNQKESNQESTPIESSKPSEPKSKPSESNRSSIAETLERKLTMSKTNNEQLIRLRRTIETHTNFKKVDDTDNLTFRIEDELFRYRLNIEENGNDYNIQVIKSKKRHQSGRDIELADNITMTIIDGGYNGFKISWTVTAQATKDNLTQTINHSMKVLDPFF